MFLEKEKLKLNPKSRIYKNTNNFIYLGKDLKGKRHYKKRPIKQINKKYYLYNKNIIKLNNLISTINYYNNIKKYK